MPNAQGPCEFTRWGELGFSQPDGGAEIDRGSRVQRFPGGTGRLGSLVLRRDGTFGAGLVRAALSVVEADRRAGTSDS